MLDAEFRAQEIKARNDLKAQLQMEKEKRHAYETEVKKQEMAIKKQKNEEIKREKALAEQ